MFERFTEKSISIINNAIEEARAQSYYILYSEHILIAFLNMPSLVGVKMLRASGADIDFLKQELSSIIKLKSCGVKEKTPVFSEGLKRNLKRAWDEARSLGANYISPEHILLAILGSKNKQLDSLLDDFGLDKNLLEQRIKKIIDTRAEKKVHPEFFEKRKKVDKLNFAPPTMTGEKSEITDVLELASQLAKENSFELIGTEQLFLSLLQKNKAIKELLEVDLDGFIQLLKQNPSREEEYSDKNYMLSPKALNAINNAYELAKEFGETDLRAEHVLLGILKEQNSKATTSLKSMNFDIDELYQKILSPMEKQKPITHSIIKLAQGEARRLGHNLVGTEMILLGILGEGSNIASKVLNNLGVTIKDTRIEVEKIIGYGDNYQDNDYIAFSARAKKIFQNSWQIAKDLKSTTIKPEHIVLAFAEMPKCVAMQLLQKLGADTLEIRQGILEEVKR